MSAARGDPWRGRALAGVVLAGALLLAGCAATDQGPLPAGAGLDYQLGGAYPPPEGVGIVARDRTARSAPGTFSICYVNGFQSQPGETDWRLAEHPDLVLRDADDHPVVDPDWPDEVLLDITTAEHREAIAGVVGGWIEGCADDGFDAVEVDNLDTYARSDGRITEDDAVALVRLLRAHADRVGLPIGQKNAAELLGRVDETGLDFAVTEECGRYDECDAFVAAYGDQVLVVEYQPEDLAATCAAHPDLSIVRRDRDLVGRGEPGYVFERCPN